MMSNESIALPMFGAVGYVLLGLPTSVSNFIIAASIAKYSALRERKEMILLMALATADAFNLLCYFGAGTYRLTLLLTDKYTMLLNSRECLKLPHMWLWSTFYPLSSVMMVVVSTDRFLLIALRGAYILRFGHKYAWSLVGVSYGISMGFGVSAVITNWFWGHQTPLLNAMCYDIYVYSASPLFVSQLFAQWHEYSASLFPLFSVVVFALIAPIYKCHDSQSNSAPVKQQLKQQQKLTKSVAVSCTCTLLLACIPGRLAYVFWYGHMHLASWCCWLLMLANPAANIIIYHYGHRDLRTAIRGFLGGKILPENLDLWPGHRCFTSVSKPKIGGNGVQAGEQLEEIEL